MISSSSVERIRPISALLARSPGTMAVSPLLSFLVAVAVGSVTAVATVGQDGANFAIKIHHRFVGGLQAQR